MKTQNPATKFLEEYIKRIENSKDKYLSGAINIKTFRENMIIDLQGYIALKEIYNKDINSHDKKLQDSIKEFSHLIPEEYQNRIY